MPSLFQSKDMIEPKNLKVGHVTLTVCVYLGTSLSS